MAGRKPRPTVLSAGTCSSARIGWGAGRTLPDSHVLLTGELVHVCACTRKRSARKTTTAGNRLGAADCRCGNRWRHRDTRHYEVKKAPTVRSSIVHRSSVAHVRGKDPVLQSRTKRNRWTTRDVLRARDDLLAAPRVAAEFGAEKAGQALRRREKPDMRRSERHTLKKRTTANRR